MTGVLGNGQRQCWVHELTSLSIRALRVFHSKNSVVILYTAILGGVARMRFKFFIQKTRCCFICPPSLAEMDCVQGWTRYKSSRCLYANCARCTVSVQTRVDQHTRTYAGQRLAQDRGIKGNAKNGSFLRCL